MILPLVFHLIDVDYVLNKLILTIVLVCTKICLLLTAPQVALRLKICEENNVIIA